MKNFLIKIKYFFLLLMINPIFALSSTKLFEPDHVEREFIVENILKPLIEPVANSDAFHWNEVSGVFINGLLIIGSFLLIYNVIIGTQDTALQGQVMGKKSSLVYSTLRSMFGVSMLIPMPSGYAVIQYLIIWFGIQGVYLGDVAWEKFVIGTRKNLTGAQGEVLINKNVQMKIIEQMRPLVEMELCRSIFNDINAQNGGGANSYKIYTTGYNSKIITNPDILSDAGAMGAIGSDSSSLPNSLINSYTLNYGFQQSNTTLANRNETLNASVCGSVAFKISDLNEGGSSIRRNNTGLKQAGADVNIDSFSSGDNSAYLSSISLDNTANKRERLAYNKFQKRIMWQIITGSAQKEINGPQRVEIGDVASAFKQNASYIAEPNTQELISIAENAYTSLADLFTRQDVSPNIPTVANALKVFVNDKFKNTNVELKTKPQSPTIGSTGSVEDETYVIAKNVMLALKAIGSSYEVNAYAEANWMLRRYLNEIDGSAWNGSGQHPLLKDGMVSAGSWFWLLNTKSNYYTQLFSGVPTVVKVKGPNWAYLDRINPNIKGVFERAMEIYDKSIAILKNEDGNEGGLKVTSIEGLLNQIMGNDYPMFTANDLIIQETENPIVTLQRLGTQMLWWAEHIFGIALSTGGAGAMLLVPAVTGVIVPAITMLYYIPMLPFILWAGSLLGWLIMIAQALFGAPLLMLAHIIPDKDGFIGGQKQGYLLILSLFLRPILMVIGLVSALVLLKPAALIINQFYVFLAKSIVNGAGIHWLVSTIVIVFLYSMIMQNTVKKIFSLIHLIPDTLLQWFGGNDQKILGEYANGIEQGAGQSMQQVGGSLGGAAQTAAMRAGMGMGAGMGVGAGMSGSTGTSGVNQTIPQGNNNIISGVKDTINKAMSSGTPGDFSTSSMSGILKGNQADVGSVVGNYQEVGYNTPEAKLDRFNNMGTFDKLEAIKNNTNSQVNALSANGFTEKDIQSLSKAGVSSVTGKSGEVLQIPSQNALALRDKPTDGFVNSIHSSPEAQASFGQMQAEYINGLNPNPTSQPLPITKAREFVEWSNHNQGTFQDFVKSQQASNTTARR